MKLGVDQRAQLRRLRAAGAVDRANAKSRLDPGMNPCLTAELARLRAHDLVKSRAVKRGRVSVVWWLTPAGVEAADQLRRGA